jgi:hypothetical protein
MSDEKGGSGSSMLLIGLLCGVGLLLAAGFLRSVIAPSLLPVGSVLASMSGWIPGLGDEAARVKRWAADPESAKTMRKDTDASLKFLAQSGKLLIPWVALLSTGLAIWVIRRSPRVRYSRKLDLEDLLQIQVKTFPRIRPILHLAGRMKESERGPFTVLRSPYAWSVLHGVIEPRPDASRTWRADKAREAFAAQLSAPGVEAVHHRWMVAVFGSIALGERSAGGGSAYLGDVLLDGLAAAFVARPVGVNRRLFDLRVKLGLWSWARWRGDVVFSIELPASLNAQLTATHGRVIASKLWADVCTRHAHIESRLVTLLGMAQAKVPVPPAAFLWIKVLDRTLWYALHGVGLLPSTSESAGIRAHMQAEAAHGSALTAPSVQAAVDALYVELEVDGWHPPKGLDLSALAPD